MTDADAAQIRIIDATSGLAIATEQELAEHLYEKQFTTFGPQNRYSVTEGQMEQIEEKYTVATDF
jgi:hypothetical protein